MGDKARSWGWLRWAGGLVVLIGLGVGGWYAIAHGKSDKGGKDPGKASTGVLVEVVHPTPGGIPRIVTQPGSVEPYDTFPAYAKVSGFIEYQKVDIGSRVKKDEVLIRLKVPELNREVDRDAAAVRDAEAKVTQMEAHIKAAEAEYRAAQASIKLAQTLLAAKSAFRSYRQRQLARIKELVAKQAESEKLQDEQEDYYLSALEAENAARENIITSTERAAAAKEKIAQARADLDEAIANVGVAQANLAKAKVFVDYTVIKAPFDGIVTVRNYVESNFVKSADQGEKPILVVNSLDKVRVVIFVPDRDVPYVEVGKPAVLHFDALGDRVYQSTPSQPVVISRKAHAEDMATRLMRTEVDVDNRDGKLSAGMFGKAELYLSDGTPGAIRIPTEALVSRGEHGKPEAKLRVVRDGKLMTLTVGYGVDNGVDVEITSGLSVADEVVVRSNVPAADGTAVTIATGAKKNSTH